LTAREASKGDLHGDTSDKIWSVYLSEADRQDEALAENWKGDMDGILIFVCFRLPFTGGFPNIFFVN